MNDREDAGGPIEQLGGLDRLLHEPARLAIAACLSVVDEADFVFLQNQTGFTAGNLSSHMSRLEDAGYVTIRKQFVGKRPQTVLSLTSAGRSAFEGYRKTMSSVLDGLESGSG